MRILTSPKWRPLALIDIDEPRIPHEFFVRCRAMLGQQPDIVRESGVLYRLRRLRSRKNWHIVIESDRLRLTPAETVALQSVLGSHWRRESFNLTRAIQLQSAPRVWRARWNVLYSAEV